MFSPVHAVGRAPGSGTVRMMDDRWEGAAMRSIWRCLICVRAVIVIDFYAVVQTWVRLDATVVCSSNQQASALQWNLMPWDIWWAVQLMVDART